MSNEKDLVLRDSAFEIQTADLSKNELPSLEDAQELPIDLCGNYWTPEVYVLSPVGVQHRPCVPAFNDYGR